MERGKIKRHLTQLIDQRAPEWLDPQVVRLGKDSSQVIDTGKPGILWARLSNGRPIMVHVNAANVPSRFDLHLVVGRRRSQPDIWQVITTLEDYDEPAGGGELTYHRLQHQEKGGDRLELNRKQIVARTVRVKDPAGFIVRIFGDPDLTPNGFVLIPNQDLDLSSHVPATGARFAAIESNDSGVLSVNAGATFASPFIGSAANYPEPAAGKYTRALILLFEGQTALLDEHIIVPMPPSFNPLAFSGISHVHALDDLEDVDAPAPTDGQVLTWSAYAEEWVAGDQTGGGVTDHGDLTGLSDDDHPQYIKHSLATAANDFLVASGAGAFIKKTLAETVTILRTVLDTVFAPIAKGVTNGDSHNHVGGDGAALNYTDVIGAFLDGNTVPASSTYHATPFRVGLAAGAGNFPWPDAGTISNMSLRTASAQPGTGSLVATLYINNVASSIVVTVPAGSGNGTFSDATHTENISAGDVIRWQFQNNASGASAQNTAISMKITKQTT